jgi:hypothetical protein
MELTEKHIICTDFICGEVLSGLGINLHCLSLLIVVWWSLEFCESWCSGFWPARIVHFNTTVSTLCDWSGKISMRPSGWQVSFPPLFCHYTDHSELSKVLYLIKWSWLLLCCMKWESPSVCWCILCFWRLLVFYASEDCWYFPENKVPCILLLLVILCVVILVLRSSWKQMVAWYWKWIADVCDTCIGPNHSQTLRFCCVLKPCTRRLECHFLCLWFCSMVEKIFCLHK